MPRPVVAVDYDGVLTSHGKVDTTVLRLLGEAGYDTVVLTANPDLKEVETALAAAGAADVMVTNEKIPAIAYVDDRAVPYSMGGNLGLLLARVKALADVPL